MCGCGKHSFKPGDRVRYDSSTGTVTRRTTVRGADGSTPAWHVRWDNGHVGVAWASDLLPEGDDDE